MRISLHNHTRWCDGRATAEEIVGAAARAGLTHVAITDHFDTTKLRPLSGITPDDMADYIAEIRFLAERYADEITVLAGVEVDFCCERTDFGLFSTPDHARRTFLDLDFVLFEYVNDPRYEGESLDALLDIRRGIALPVGLAHPDIMMAFRGLIPRAAAGILAQNDVFLELCPSMRNAVRAPTADADAERIEDELARVGAELDTAVRRLDEDHANAQLRTSVARLERKIHRLHSRCERMPSYRVPHRFIDEFFDAVKASSVLLSIGPDGHASGGEATEIDDAVEFVQERGLSENVITTHLWKR